MPDAVDYHHKLAGEVLERCEWCPRCLLPSAMRVQVHELSLEGITPVSLWLACPDCEWAEEQK